MAWVLEAMVVRSWGDFHTSVGLCLMQGAMAGISAGGGQMLVSVKDVFGWSVPLF